MKLFSFRSHNFVSVSATFDFQLSTLVVSIKSLLPFISIQDYIETERLLSADNVNHEALLSYAREAADFGTNYQLPSLDYAINHYGQPDVAMFDFTSMHASENAALIREKHGHQLVVALVGDSLLEVGGQWRYFGLLSDCGSACVFTRWNHVLCFQPFWPMGTGCARGFLAAFDTAWMVRGWAQGRSPLEILAERCGFVFHFLSVTNQSGRDC